jgi:iron complex outermembrane receptor protein
MVVATALLPIAGLIASSPASAQPQTGSDLEEIVVTARYRSESLQETPLAITAVTADELEARNITNVVNLGAVVPNAFITQGTAASAGAPTISMRGVFQADFIFTFEPGVAIYIDDVYRPTLLGSDLDLMDIDRIEVLRGPQGTLFGKNSMGGSLRIVSKLPEGSDSGYAELTVGDQGRLDVRGGFDAALVPDKLFMRVSGATKHIDGYVRLLDFSCHMTVSGTPQLIPAGVSRRAFSNADDCVMGEEGGQDLNAGRVMLRYLPTERLELNLAFDRTVDNKEVTPDTTLGLLPQSSAAAQGLLNPSVYPWVQPDGTRDPSAPAVIWDERFLAPDRYSSYAYMNSPNVSNLEENGATASASLEISDHLRSKIILGRREYHSESSFNADASPYGFIENWNPIDHEQTSAEIQLSGEAFGERLEWTAGLYYFDAETKLEGHIIYAGLSFDQDDLFCDTNESVFLHGVYQFSDRLHGTAGVRYSRNEKRFDYLHVGLPPGLPFSATFTDTRPDWTLGIDYDINDDVLFYASVSTGYRPGGVNPRPIIVPDQLVAFDGEELTSYELGLKSTMRDGRLRLNVAAFYSDYTSRLSSATLKQCVGAPGTPVPFLPTAACPAGTLFEVPWFAYFNDGAEVTGIEAELTAEPVDGLMLNVSIGTNDFSSDVTDPTAVNYRHPANLIQPEVNATAGIQYEFSLPFGTITPRLDWLYVSEMTYSGVLSQPFDPRFGLPPQAAYDLTSTPSRDLFNARIGFLDRAGKWEAALAVVNLTDEFYYLNKFDQSGLVVSGIPSRPRAWSLTLKRNFE